MKEEGEQVLGLDQVRVAESLYEPDVNHAFTCTTFAGGKPLNQVAEALL